MILIKILGGKGQRPGQFIQAAGVTIDNEGNFLAICSKTSRIMAFKSNGDFICDVKFESGPIERPSDISINDDGLIAITSLKGQVSLKLKWKILTFFQIHLLQLVPIEPSSKWQSIIRFEYNSANRGNRGHSRGRGRGRPTRGR